MKKNLDGEFPRPTPFSHDLLFSIIPSLPARAEPVRIIV
jgi:bifunctional DNase/RNase